MTRIDLFVPGEPAPQGSKTAGVDRSGRVYMRESSARVKPWRAIVTWHAKAAKTRIPPGVPVRVNLAFSMPRPTGHYGTGRNASTLRPSAPTTCLVKPDIDKLTRAVLDGLVDAGTIRDDSHVVSLTASKRYTDTSHPPGCDITITQETS